MRSGKKMPACNLLTALHLGECQLSLTLNSNVAAGGEGRGYRNTTFNICKQKTVITPTLTLAHFVMIA